MRGFALIEIIVAILISSFLLSQVTASFGAMMRVHSHYADRVRRLPVLKTILNTCLLDAEIGEPIKPYTKKIADPDTDITLAVQKINEKEMFGKLDGIKRVRVSATWPDQQTSEPMDLVMYMYIPEEKS